MLKGEIIGKKEKNKKKAKGYIVTECVLFFDDMNLINCYLPNRFAALLLEVL